MNLGDFSSQLKGLSITPGSVFRMILFPKDGITPKNEGDISRTKYFVVIGKDKDSILVGSLLINSEVNANLINAIAPYQHCIYPEDYSFLGGKYRFIDCYRIKELQFNSIIESAEYIGAGYGPAYSPSHAFYRNRCAHPRLDASELLRP